MAHTNGSGVDPDPLGQARGYLSDAAECMRLAGQAVTAETAKAFVQIAKSYEELAEDMELIHENRQRRAHDRHLG